MGCKGCKKNVNNIINNDDIALPVDIITLRREICNKCCEFTIYKHYAVCTATKEMNSILGFTRDLNNKCPNGNW